MQRKRFQGEALQIAAGEAETRLHYVANKQGQATADLKRLKGSLTT